MSISRRKFLLGGFIVTAGALLLDAFWGEHFFIEKKLVYLDTDPFSDQHLKILQISDLHLQSVNYQLEQLAKDINQQQPDLIAITGDSIDAGKNHYVLDEFLQLIDKNIPKVAILGNWEYWAGLSFSDLTDIYQKHNCQLLVNQNKRFELKGKTVSITGIDDFIGGKPDFEKAVKDHQPSDYHIVLNHCPVYSDSIAKMQGGDTKADLILSGHTHGGQLNIMGFAPFKPWGSGKYLKGMYHQNNTRIYVSRGIGTTKLPIRFGARSEVTLFHFKA